jgi:hypothetical protein
VFTCCCHQGEPPVRNSARLAFTCCCHHLLLLLWLLPRTPNVHDAGLQEEAHLLGDLHACVAPRERAGGERQRAGESEREREREGETRERARSRE